MSLFFLEENQYGNSFSSQLHNRVLQLYLSRTMKNAFLALSYKKKIAYPISKKLKPKNLIKVSHK